MLPQLSPANENLEGWLVSPNSPATRITTRTIVMTGDPTHSSQSPSEAQLFMPEESRYAGQPIDTSSRRSIRIVPSERGDTIIKPTDRQVVVDFFYHEGTFWRAVIPLDGVQEVYGQAFNFSKDKMRNGANGPEIRLDRHGLPKRSIPILNHVQSRFTLDSESPVKLYPLGSEESGDPFHRLSDFVYSLEAVGPLGISFNLRDGLAGSLISAHRFLSTQEMVFERLVVERQYVTESPPIPIGTPEKRVLLTESLLRSHRAGMAEAYFLYRFCGTGQVVGQQPQDDTRA